MEGISETVFPVIADTPWECVALLCDRHRYTEKRKRLEVFEEIMIKAKEYNIDPSRLHIDPLVEMLCTSEDGVNMIVDVMKEIKAQYPTIHITGAVSNISFNLPVRRLVNQAFAVLAMNAGMDSFILDPLNEFNGYALCHKSITGQKTSIAWNTSQNTGKVFLAARNNNLKIQTRRRRSLCVNKKANLLKLFGEANLTGLSNNTSLLRLSLGIL